MMFIMRATVSDTLYEGCDGQARSLVYRRLDRMHGPYESPGLNFKSRENSARLQFKRVSREMRTLAQSKRITLVWIPSICALEPRETK